MSEQPDSISTTIPRRAEDAIGFRPLYRQVYDRLLHRLATAAWQPGEMLPSEGQLAVELGVSQGTIRKALDALTADNLLVRRQGRGTFVAEHDAAQTMFRFFKLRTDAIDSGTPESRVVAINEAVACDMARERLAIPNGARVIRVDRLRFLDGNLRVAETIALPCALFPGLATSVLPNTLYGLYASAYGITIALAKENLRAITLRAHEADLLEVACGTAALEIDRVAYDLEERPVEWRRSICLTHDVHYVSILR